jgi:hypothetical protein
MIPEEDRGPSWLRDYGYTDFGDIAADIHAMEEYAKKLAADLEANYAPHMATVSAAMLTRLPEPNAAFYELTTFLESHKTAQEVTHENVYAYANGTDALAGAAKEISGMYQGSDAFARATVKDVDATLVLDPSASTSGNGDV